uniref:Kinase n=1 Tax=Romanomermis culicivorax TaxID=13658 RepID=A0A915KJH6_ROMCU
MIASVFGVENIFVNNESRTPRLGGVSSKKWKKRKSKTPPIRPLVAMDSIVQPPQLPQNYSFYSFQIAGHHYSKQKDENFGKRSRKNANFPDREVRNPAIELNQSSELRRVLLCEETGRILKPLQKPPRGTSEVIFYENVWTDDANTSNDRRDVFHQLRNFVPKFYGVKELTSSGMTGRFLELENLTCAFKKPCVIDIKIGARTWDPLAPQDKIAYEKSKYPHAQTLGFRFLGTMVYKENTDDYEHHDKEWGKMLTENDVLPALQSYFPKELRPCKILAACILRKLHKILHFFSHQRLLTFFSSSILMSYEGANLIEETDNMLTSIITTNSENCGTKTDSNNEKFEADDLLRKFDALNCIPTASTSSLDEKEEIFYRKFDSLFSVKMIDFTHVFEHTDSDDEEEENQQSRAALDDNYLHGLKNLIKYLTIFLDSLVL